MMNQYLTNRGFEGRTLPLLLIMPPQHWMLEGFTSGLVALACYVQRNLPDAVIKVLDLSHTAPEELRDAVARVLRTFKIPPLVGITTTTATYQSALEVASLCKDACPECKIVLGGHHTRAQDKLILENHRGQVDYVIQGEGEIPLVSILQEYPDLSRVPGLTYRAWDGRIIRNTPAALLEQSELDQVSMDFPGIEIHSPSGKFGHVTYVSARGCPLKCAFCAVSNERIRAKSIPQVIADLRHLTRDLGYTNIAIEDNFFAQSPVRTVALCEAITKLQREEKLDFSWDCQTRVESMRRLDVLAAMAKANCEAVYLGVEALEETSLAYLNKTTQPEHYLSTLERQVVPQVMNSSVNCYINLQLGVPGETEQAWQKTLTRIQKLGKIAQSYGKTITIFPQLHVVYPGTKHFNDGVLQRRFPENIFESFTEWEHHEIPTRRFLGEEFAHGTGGIPEAIIDPECLRYGRDYHVNLDAVLQIMHQFREIEAVEGISIFRYGKYLVKGDLEIVQPISEETSQKKVAA